MGSRNAKRVKNLHGMEQIALDIKPRRSDSFVYSQVDLDMTNLVKYIEKKKKQGEKITVFHAFVTAIGKVLYNREKLNNFVQNRHVFKHNDVVVGFVAKVAFEDHAEEMMIMVPIKEDDNIDTISKFIKGKVDGIRTREFKKEGANDAIDVLGKLPNIIRVPLVGLLKWMDDKGLLPASFNTYNIVEIGDIIIRPTDLQNDKRSLRTGLVTEKGIITSAYIDLAPKRKLNSKFFHYLLHSYDIKKVFYNMGNGVRQGLNYSEFSKLMVFSPPTREQDAIVEFLDDVCSKIELISLQKQKQITILENFKKSLIYEYVTGKKEIV